MFSLLRCLFLASPSIFVACAVEFQVGVLRSRGFFGVISSPARIDNSAFLCLLFCLHEKCLRFTDSKHCFAADEKTALHEYFGHWWEFEITFSRMLPRNKNAPWRQLLYDVMADTIGYIQIKMKSATLQLARTHARFTHCARASRATRL